MKHITYSHPHDLLVDYSRFLLGNQLDALSEFQLRIAYEYKLPLLKKHSALSHGQLLDLTKKGYVEFLSYWATWQIEKQIIIV